ncbi:hypothetical protein PR048_028718 [Dryococelus australis]|uniref:Uncharacterized protein n=1 Tax=Dryococelus australis TaxID=614101 RepID=A0ABQ9GBC5_9NEOP|nr:hypothetical protein PR048_028718 [Dryococelus australis]
MRVPAQKTRSHSAASAVVKRNSNAAPSASAKKRKVQDCSPTRAKSPSALAKRKAPAKRTVVAKRTTVVVKKMTAKKKEAANKRKPSSVKSTICKKKEGKGSTTNVKKKADPQKIVASKAVVLKKQSGNKKEPAAEASAVASTSADKPAEKEAHVSPEETRKKPPKKATAQPKEKVRVVKIQKPKSAAATSSVKSKKKLPPRKQQVPKTVCKKPFVKHVVIGKGGKQKAAASTRKKSGTGDSKAKCSMLSVTEKTKKSSVVGKKSPSSNKGSVVDIDVEKKSPVNIANTKEVVSESFTVKKAKNTVIKRKPKKIDGVESEGTSDNVVKTPSRQGDEDKPHTQDSNSGNIGSHTQKRKCLSKKKPNPKSKQMSGENDTVLEEHNIEDEVSISFAQSQNKDIFKDGACTSKVLPKNKDFGTQHESSEIADTQPTTTESTDESTTSDEITLDRLRQQQLRVVKATNPVEGSSGCEDKIDKSIQVKPSSPCGTSRSEELVSTCDSMQFMGGISIKKEVEDDVEVKLESDTDNSSRSTSARKYIRKKHTSSVICKDRSGDTEEDGDVEDEDDDDEKFKTTAQSSKKFGALKNSDTDQRARRMRLFGFWSGPKRHRVASLNALAKVHCLYENESRGALLGYCRAPPKVTKKVVKHSPEEEEDDESSSGTVVCTRTLRSMPGLRGAGRHWDVLTGLSTSTSSSSVSSSSSDDNENDNTGDESGSVASPPETTGSPGKGGKKVVRRKRKRSELMMDLKDMVVRKRMASLNASAILAASYSVEKRPPKTQPKQEPNPSPPPGPATRKKSRKRVLSKKIIEEDDDSSSSGAGAGTGAKEVESRSVIELRTTPSSSNQVAVIVNQDTDVTITGVYVNSTTRSTHHEGFCSIAGMQYRISSTSHTQTEATAVATETVLHTAPPPAAPDLVSTCHSTIRCSR